MRSKVLGLTDKRLSALSTVRGSTIAATAMARTSNAASFDDAVDMQTSLSSLGSTVEMV